MVFSIFKRKQKEKTKKIETPEPIEDGQIASGEPAEEAAKEESSGGFFGFFKKKTPQPAESEPVAAPEEPALPPVVEEVEPAPEPEPEPEVEVEETPVEAPEEAEVEAEEDVPEPEAVEPVVEETPEEPEEAPQVEEPVVEDEIVPEEEAVEEEDAPAAAEEIPEDVVEEAVETEIEAPVEPEAEAVVEEEIPVDAPEPDPESEPEPQPEPEPAPEPEVEVEVEAEIEAEPEAEEEEDVEDDQEVEDEDEEPVAEEAPKAGLFSRLKQGLSRTRSVFGSDVGNLLKTGKPITEDLFDELEEMLVTSDMGMMVAMDMMERIRTKAKKLEYAAELKAVLKEELLGLFPKEEEETEPAPLTKPHVIMVVGVNGTGKTTTLGKLATRFTREGKKVLLVAADTFRAAATDQLQIWADRAECGIVRHREGADPAAVAYDGIAAAVARKVDVVLVDTAGRLHTQKNLMEELKKIKRTIDKKMKGAPHEVLMVLDATTGQNAISQAKIFNEAVELTQFALTKLDGTAKGGIAAAVAGTMSLPIKYIGVGESMEDLQDFNAEKFIDAIFEE